MQKTFDLLNPAIFSDITTPVNPDAGYLSIYSKSGVLTTLNSSGVENSFLTSSEASALYLPLTGGTLTGDLLFTDATYDIGKSGATRPRDGFFSRNLAVGSQVTVPYGDSANPAILIGNTNTGIHGLNDVSRRIRFTVGGTLVAEYAAGAHIINGTLQFATLGASAKTGLVSPSIGVLEIRQINENTTAQTLELNNTWASTTSFEKLRIQANAGSAYQIGSAVGSAGGTLRAVNFGIWDAAGTFTTALSIPTNGNRILTGTNGSLLLGASDVNNDLIYSSRMRLGVQASVVNLMTTTVGFGSAYIDSWVSSITVSGTSSTFATTSNAGSVTIKSGNNVADNKAAEHVYVSAGNAFNSAGVQTYFAGGNVVLTAGAGGGTNGLGGDIVLIAGSGTISGKVLIQQSVSSSGSPTAFTVTGAAHTTLTASTESTDINFNLARTVQFATGALTTQRAMRIQAPTYSFVSASTIATASTLSISGSPVAGTNATITSGYALNVESGNSYFGGAVTALSGWQSGHRYSAGSAIWETTNCLVIDLGAWLRYDYLINRAGIAMARTSDQYIGWAGYINATNPVVDTRIYSDGSGILALRNGTNAQSLGVYGTYTSSTSYERVNIRGKASANFEIGPENGSAGGTLRGLTIGGYSAGSTTITPWLTFDPTGGAASSSVVKFSNFGGSFPGVVIDHSSAVAFFSIRGNNAGQSHHTIGLGTRGSIDSSGSLNAAIWTGSGFSLGIYTGGVYSLPPKWLWSASGDVTCTPAVSTSGSPTAFTLTGAAHTTLTASTEATDVNFNLARTVQFATGALTTQRAMRIQAPTYSAVGASTITTASTLSISGPPIAGTNATITNASSLYIESGFIRQDAKVSATYDGTTRLFGEYRYGASSNTYTVMSDSSGCFHIGNETHKQVLNFWHTPQSRSRVTIGASGPDNAAYGKLGVFGGAVDGTGVVFTICNGYHVISLRAMDDGAITNVATAMIEQRNGTTAQSNCTYGTYTSATSYERVNIRGKASANFEIGPENGSAGGTLRGLTIGGYSAGSSTITPWLTFNNAGAATFSANLLVKADRHYVGSANYGATPVALLANLYSAFTDRSIAKLCTTYSFGDAVTVFGVSVNSSHQTVTIGNGGFASTANGTEASSATPVGGTIIGTGGSGTNIAGASICVAGGRGTGTAVGGSVKIQVAPAGSSGTTVNSLVDAVVVDSTKKMTCSGQIVETPPASVTLSTNGQFSVEMTSDTTGNLVYRGSDGTTRRMGMGFDTSPFLYLPLTGGVLTQPVSTTGSPTVFAITGGAHTTLTASTEATDVNFNLARTVQFATGALTTQRAFRIQAPTYGFVGASTITTASTLSISGPPIAGTNATITNAYALNVESGTSNFGGDVVIASSLTVAGEIIVPFWEATLTEFTSSYVYMGGTPASGWKINRYNNSGVKTSATIVNNGSYATLAAAWTDRVSLTYA